MNPSTDESQLRQLIQRLKQADGPRTPDFGEVLARPVRTPKPARRFQLAVIVCTVAAVLSGFVFFRSQQGDSTPGKESHRAESSRSTPPAGAMHHELAEQPVADIDFDHLRRVVEEFCDQEETADSLRVPLWTSRTESLLAWHLDATLTQE